jgi:hypothetical protein
MKILESKRSEIRKIGEFHRIPNEFPNLGLSCMSGGETPVEAYVGIEEAYLGSFGE